MHCLTESSQYVEKGAVLFPMLHTRKLTSRVPSHSAVPWRSQDLITGVHCACYHRKADRCSPSPYAVCCLRLVSREKGGSIWTLGAQSNRGGSGTSAVQVQFLKGLSQEPPPKCGDSATLSRSPGTQGQLPPESTGGGEGWQEEPSECIQLNGL